MNIGELFTEKTKVLKGFDKIKNEPIIEDVETSWETVEIYDERNILAKNKNGELKRFLIE
ncbi:MAG: hypothetical protein J6D12_01825 [Peptostreptococcaceae bacterium]|nr:hypothetical protein [Peptostreptococcaceae bacterium]